MTIQAITLGSDFAKALVAAYKELRNPKLDADNTYFNSRYASLSACRDAAVPILANHGITVMQDLTTTTVDSLDGGLMMATECRTILLHESGQGVQLGPFTVPADKPTAQALGSAATYNRRYTLNGATCIAGDPDDDGNAASATGAAPHSTQAPAPQAQSSAPTDPTGAPATIRPTGLFGYGKKFVDTPWNVMAFSQLEWFRDADHTPAMIRDKCRAEIAWRNYEITRMDAAKAHAKAADSDIDDSDIPM